LRTHSLLEDRDGDIASSKHGWGGYKAAPDLTTFTFTLDDRPTMQLDGSDHVLASGFWVTRYKGHEVIPRALGARESAGETTERG